MGVAQVPGISISTEIELARCDIGNNVSQWQFYLPSFSSPELSRTCKNNTCIVQKLSLRWTLIASCQPLRSHPGSLSDAHPPPRPTPSARPHGENNGAWVIYVRKGTPVVDGDY